MKKTLLALALLFMPIVCMGAAPIIWYTDIINGPKTGGENNNGCYLTITGTGFGTPSANLPPATTKVYINDVEVAAYKYLGQLRGRPDAWQLAVQIGGSVSSGAIKVTTSEGTATAPENFTVNTGTMLFISPSGSDSSGDGTWANPWKTPNKAILSDSFDVGTHIVIKDAGTYLLTDADANIYSSRWFYMGLALDSHTGPCAGTSNNHITFMGYPGKDIVVDWGTNTTIRGIEAVAAASYDYWAFSNIKFDVRNAQFAIYFQADNLLSCPDPATNETSVDYLRLVNVTVTNALSGCTFGGGYNVIDIMSASHAKVYGVDIGNQAATASDACPSHAFYYAFHHQDVDVAYCYFHDMPYGTRGILQFAGDGGGGACFTYNTDTRVHHNYFKNLAGSAILMNLGANEIDIYNNIFEDCANGTNTSVTGWTVITMRGGKSAEAGGTYRLFNNTFYSAVSAYDTQALIQMAYNSDYPESVTLRNNLIVSTDTNTSYYTTNSSGYVFDPFSRCTLSNNIYYGSSVYNKRNTANYATYGNIPGGELTAFDSGGGSSTQSPLFTNAAGSDFTLTSSSPAKDAGYDLSGIFTTDYTGRTRTGTWDIGAYEYYADSPTPTYSNCTMSGVQAQ